LIGLLLHLELENEKGFFGFIIVLLFSVALEKHRSLNATKVVLLTMINDYVLEV